jgi:rhodanese-related sulfurtransferase/DNA-binding transcriptional ArsR family regulator
LIVALITEPRREQKEHLYSLFALIANALANPHRLELLDLLVQAPRTVEELAKEAHMSLANTSQHLQRLKQAHLVSDKRTGSSIRYRLADPAVAGLWLELRAVGELRLAEVERALDAYRDQRHQFPNITPAELIAGLQLGQVLLLDVRPASEYQAGHLPGAISIPLDELPGKLDQIASDRLVAAYCRGPYCAYADQALTLLAAHGYSVARLEEGIAEWQQSGYSLEDAREE